MNDTKSQLLAAAAFAITLAAAFVLASSVGPAKASTDPTEHVTPHYAAQGATCNTHDIVKQVLKRNYGEEPVARGLSHDGKLMELWVSYDGATWSLTMTDPNGTTCLVSDGSYYETVEPEPAGEDM